MCKENLSKKGPLFGEFGAQKSTHLGGTYPYSQHAKYPHPLEFRTELIPDWFHATFRAFLFENAKTVWNVSDWCVIVQTEGQSDMK